MLRIDITGQTRLAGSAKQKPFLAHILPSLCSLFNDVLTESPATRQNQPENIVADTTQSRASSPALAIPAKSSRQEVGPAQPNITISDETDAELQLPIRSMRPHVVPGTDSPTRFQSGTAAIEPTIDNSI